MSKEGAFNDEDYSWLVGTPASDGNFKSALERASVATIKGAVKHFEEVGGSQSKVLALRRQLRKVTVLEGGAAEASNQAILDTANRQERTTNMELATLQQERETEDNRGAEQVKRERMIGQCFKAIGQVQTSNMFAKFATVSSLVWLREVKADKIYRDIPGIGTWDKFCDSVGMSRQKVDEDLANLAAFGEQFLTTCQQLSVGYRELRKLRQLTYDGAVIIDAECIQIGEETIPINEDHAEDLQVAIERILEDRTKLNSRVERLEKNLDAVVKEETKGLQSEKKLLQKELDRLKAFDPEGMDPARFKEQFKVIHETVAALASQIGKVVIIEGLESDPHLAAQVEGFVASAEQLTRGLRQQWEEKFNIYA
uniref:Uncharacterized protein n=1 Tax=Geobacter sp. (strain M21) TaxID=443144 RepID=C6E6U1_GEOSM